MYIVLGLIQAVSTRFVVEMAFIRKESFYIYIKTAFQFIKKSTYYVCKTWGTQFLLKWIIKFLYIQESSTLKNIYDVVSS